MTPTRRGRVAAMVVTYNNADTIDLLLGDLAQQEGTDIGRIIVVDNASSDDTVATVRSWPCVQLIEAGDNLGYAAAINLGMTKVDRDEYLLVLNPDLRMGPTTVAALLHRAFGGADVVAPRIVDDSGELYRSIRREPTVARQFTDAVLGSRIRRPGRWSSETVTDHKSYLEPHTIDWATGAALLISPRARAVVGPWDEQFFLYSEETDFTRRVRDNGLSVWFEPLAEVRHAGGGSGRSEYLDSLLVANKVAYIRKHYGRFAGLISRYIQILSTLLRWRDPSSHRIRGALLTRDSTAITIEYLRGPKPRSPRAGEVNGSIIIPAHNEEHVIGGLLERLAPLASDSSVEIVVVCNGCDDQTASVARQYPEIMVCEIPVASKTAAIRAGDEAATQWPRLYVDADVLLSTDGATETLRALSADDALAARPRAAYDTHGADLLTRSFYRARSRMAHLHERLWGAGVYGLSRTAHSRLGDFPDLVADDLWVDRHFAADEISVIHCDPVIVRTPRSRHALSTTLRRVARGNLQIANMTNDHQVDTRRSTKSTFRELLRTIRGPRSLTDALIFAGFSLLARARQDPVLAWERDETTRSEPDTLIEQPRSATLAADQATLSIPEAE